VNSQLRRHSAVACIGSSECWNDHVSEISSQVAADAHAVVILDLQAGIAAKVS
jgi:hypothetical protein